MERDKKYPLPTASAKQLGRTQIYHGLPAPIQATPRTAPAFDWRKTRLLPIEELTRASKQPLPEAATRATGGWQSRLRLDALPLGRIVRLGVGLLTLLLAGYGSLANVRASTRPVAAAPVAIEPLPRVVPEPPPVAPPAVEKRRAVSKRVTPRQAGDQLAAGDLARAAKTYEQLAERAPDDAVYREAARILRLRVARP